MKERPIIFSGPMVRAILDGRKTQTRRVIKPQPRRELVQDGPTITWIDTFGHTWKCPYGQPGYTLLWVRETCKVFTGLPITPEYIPWPESAPWKTHPNPYECLLHIAGNEHHIEALDRAAACVTVPSIHMPRWASRITLEVTEVRVERVQDISEADAIAEGSQIPCDQLPKSCQQGCLTERTQYSRIWDSINAKKHPWSSNPWVWVVSFKTDSDSG